MIFAFCPFIFHSVGSRLHTVGDMSQENRDLELAWIFLAGWRRLLAWIFLARFLSAAASPEPPLKRLAHFERAVVAYASIVQVFHPINQPVPVTTDNAKRRLNFRDDLQGGLGHGA